MASNEVPWPSSFKSIGKLSVGNSYGHIHTVVDVSETRKVLESAMEFVTTAQNKHLILHSTFEVLKQEIEPNMVILDRLESAFFKSDHEMSPINTRKPRQAGIGIGLGVVGIGMSIYNSYKISELRAELQDVRQGTRLIAQELIEQYNATQILSESMKKIHETCKIIIAAAGQVNERTRSMIAFEYVSVLVKTLTNDFGVWVRGLESLLQGTLRPSLVKTEDLRKSLQELQNKAEKKGYHLLNRDLASIYKEAITYVATEDKKIEIYLHIPLMDRKPLDLYEYISIPINMTNELMVFIEEKSKNLLAMDEFGSVGLELQKNDLVHCKVRPTANGKLFNCPNTGLLESDVKKTCLGAIMHGQKSVMEEKCHIFIEKRQNFHIQVGPTKIIALVKPEEALYEICSDGKRHRRGELGLTTLEGHPSCTIISPHFIFKADEELDLEGNFIERINLIQLKIVTENNTNEEIERAYEELSTLGYPAKRSLSQIREWLSNSKNPDRMAPIVGTTGLVLAFLSVGVLMVLYARFRCRKAQTSRTGGGDLELSGRECHIP